MKPSGSASRKNACSSAASAKPAQPSIIARGWFMALGPDEDAGDIAALELAAQPLGGGAVCHRRGLDAVINPARAEIRARPGGGQVAEHVAIGAADPFPLQSRRLLAAQGAELEAEAAACCRRGLGRGGDWAGGGGGGGGRGAECGAG